MRRKLIEAIDHATIEKMEIPSLLDCYRIELDFVMPAALKAYEKSTLEPASNNVGLSVMTDE